MTYIAWFIIALVPISILSAIGTMIQNKEDRQIQKDIRDSLNGRKV